MQFCNTGPTRGNLQLLRFLSEQFCHYLTPEVSSKDFEESQFESYILDIIEDRVTAPTEIIERGQLYGADYLDSCVTLALQLEQHTDMYLSYAKEQLKQLFPDTIPVIARDTIVMVLSLSGRENEKDSFFAKLRTYLGNAGALAGESEPFSGLVNFRESYLQAMSALQVGHRLRERGPSFLIESALPSEDTRLFSYARCNIYSMLLGDCGTPSLVKKRRYR